jgi:septum formation protein
MLVLASRSPRRREILRLAGIPFVVRAKDVDETPVAGETAREYVKRIAREKACAAELREGETVLAADTTVTIDGEILAKPLDQADARRMLRLLSGRRHEVLTGICLRSATEFVVDCAETSVWFAPLSEREIAEYAAGGEPLDKAGAYAIQGLASKFVQRIEGCYFNVMGLPVAMVYGMLKARRTLWDSGSCSA